ncbi:zinc finger CCCH domain-containing protein 54 [Actinidia eriantha]|uniref:zinc finger CCCH domain-containing protein 54 n=1 Tax=Actinidia eriantha TaxID=165200 RepID=UPI00258C10EC|nr:zinc finger CCCH domain-containing protein 54 [Actinidia eriantha]
MISKMLSSTNPAYYEFSEQELARIDPSHYPDLFDETIYESDEFRMYGFKIKRCPRMRSHDWTQCPFAHRGEKARRRDPRRYNYSAVACPDYRNGECRRGETCHFAHGVFEYWLHPAKYRTRACNAGGLCQRKVCFFAHTAEELRDETKYHYVYRVRSNGGDTVGKVPYGGNGATSSSATPLIPVAPRTRVSGNSDFLASLSGLTIREGTRTMGDGIFSWCVPESNDDPDIDWITEMVE